jgi:hypothetical protein
LPTFLLCRSQIVLVIVLALVLELLCGFSYLTC